MTAGYRILPAIHCLPRAVDVTRCASEQTERAATSIVRFESSSQTDAGNTMFEPDSLHDPDDAALEDLYQHAPAGALTVAGIATAVVFSLWLAFYLLVFLPRGLLH